MPKSSWSLSPAAELDEAITWFRRRLAIPNTRFEALQEGARRTGFWMAKVRTAQRAKKIQDSLQDALAHGMDFATWKKNARSSLRGISDAHLRTTFRNWTQSAYNGARVNYLMNPQVMRRRPYWVFDAVMDGNTTPVCVAYNGVVLKAGHTWFLRHTPPLHHNCRSSVRGLTGRQAERLGIRQRAPSPKLSRAQIDREGAKLEPQPVRVDDGFGTHVLEPWEPTTKQVPRGFRVGSRPVTL